MPKGNHVFNHFQKSIDNAFARLIDAAGWMIPEGSTNKLSLARAKSQLGSDDAVFLATRLPKAWPKFREIIGCAPFIRWDEMQDNNSVLPSDLNSRLYGDAANSFATEIAKIGRQESGANPGFHWTKMIETGYDAGAATHWINSARAPEKPERERRIRQTQAWIKGQLTGFVNTWIQYLRLDMDGKK